MCELHYFLGAEIVPFQIIIAGTRLNGGNQNNGIYVHRLDDISPTIYLDKKIPTIGRNNAISPARMFIIYNF